MRVRGCTQRATTAAGSNSPGAVACRPQHAAGPLLLRWRCLRRCDAACLRVAVDPRCRCSRSLASRSAPPCRRLPSAPAARLSMTRQNRSARVPRIFVGRNDGLLGLTAWVWPRATSRWPIGDRAGTGLAARRITACRTSRSRSEARESIRLARRRQMRIVHSWSVASHRCLEGDPCELSSPETPNHAGGPERRQHAGGH